MGNLALYLGVILVFLGSILFLCEAFRESLLWGLACFLFAPSAIVFLLVHWSRVESAVLMQIAGGFLILFGGAAI